MNAKSRWACRFSIRLLVGHGWAYLWTLTTPDEVELKELSQRWRKLIWNGFEPCVRVFERHPGGHGYHVHFVTANRLDVEALRPRAEQAGFGRINVKRLPGTAAEYISKYLTKQRTLPGVRLWSCVGFAGVPVKRIKATTERELLPKLAERTWSHAGFACTEVVWQYPGSEETRIRLRKAETEEQESERRYTLNAAQWGEILADFEAGEFIIIGAYRGVRIVTRVVEVEQSTMKNETVRLEHVVERAGKDCVFTEWRTPLADVQAVKPAAAWDAIVKVRVTRVTPWRGETYWEGEVLPLLGRSPALTGGQTA